MKMALTLVADRFVTVGLHARGIRGLKVLLHHHI